MNSEDTAPVGLGTSVLLKAVGEFEEWQSRVARQGSRHVHSLFPVLFKLGASKEAEYREADDDRYLSRYFDVGLSDQPLPFFDPFVQTWLNAGYAHSNIATTRKKTFGLAWRACEWDIETNVLTLMDDYVAIFSSRALTKARRTHPIPFAAFMLWFAGMDALRARRDDDGNSRQFPAASGRLADDAAAFGAMFGLSRPEMDQLFDFDTALATEYERLADDLARHSVRLPELGPALLHRYPIESSPAPAPGPAGRTPPSLGFDFEIEALAGELYLPLEALQEMSWGLRSKGALVLAGPPGSGKTFIARRIASHLAGDRVESVQFHPGYSYESFVSGYKPQLSASGQLSYALVPGPLLEVSAAAREAPDRLHVLLIDELNRANVPAVFGELLSALEYRDEPIRLQYGDPFDGGGKTWSMPDNVLVVATMNNVDRSAGQLDSAVRRRFAFVDVSPGKPPFDTTLTSYLRDKWDDGSRDWVAAWMTDLNEMLPNPEFAIGLSYFVNSSLTEFELTRIVRQEIRPYLAAHYDLSQHNAIEAQLDFYNTPAYLEYHRQPQADEDVERRMPHGTNAD